ncbi:MAG: CRISPR-associated helicase Cas3' [Thermodesulfobacteriota bacterium]
MTSTKLEPYFKYWGKAEKCEDGKPPRYHLLPYHCLDVAAVGQVLLQKSPSLRRKFGVLTALDETICHYWLLFFLTLHDIGKFAKSFQALRNDLLQQLQGERSSRPYIRHDRLGYVLWEQKLSTAKNFRSWLGIETDDANLSKWSRALLWFARPMTGHHGEPPRKEGLNNLMMQAESSFSTTDTAASKEFLDDVAGLFHRTLPHKEVPGYSKHLKAKWEKASWFLAGFTVLCDWIGSNDSWFPFLAKTVSLNDYWTNYALPQAETAVMDTGISLDSPAPDPSDFPGLFPGFTRPTPLQRFVAGCEVAPSPQLFILEDVTGSGKTEAALFLARQLMAKKMGKGIFIALPTMATSNAMFSRLEKVYRLLFHEGTEPSLVLAHGRRHLSASFMRSISSPEQTHNQASYSTDEETATGQCSAWLADNRKKALLADVGVGTLDQALLAILPSRFQSLRLFGLSETILIVDEVHAYDPYMNRLLQTLLTFHASFGGSAILLSATLPKHIRQQMISSFAAGLGSAQVPQAFSEAYPLATHLSLEMELGETPVEADPRSSRNIPTRIIMEQGEVCREIETAALQGKCVCWIRNTVQDALDGHEELKKKIAIDKLILFHARFAMGDRLDTERIVDATFGKKSGEQERQGQVLVATQVVEQSLDLDFDLLISDLAPMDLLIQRAGRIHRHIRDERGNPLPDGSGPDRRELPCLLIHSPDPADEADDKWFKEAFPKAACVYPSHGCLWLTARLLRDKGHLMMPDDARNLIKAAFSEKADELIPSALRQRDFDAEAKRMTDTSLAHINMLKIEEGYCATANQWREDMLTPTRLGDMESTLRLARWDGQTLAPWYDAQEFPWDMSQVNIRASRVASELTSNDPNLARAGAELKELLPDKGKWSLLIPLTPAGDGSWQGEALDGRGREVILIYKRETGLSVSGKE